MLTEDDKHFIERLSEAMRLDPAAADILRSFAKKAEETAEEDQEKLLLSLHIEEQEYGIRFNQDQVEGFIADAKPLSTVLFNLEAAYQDQFRNLSITNQARFAVGIYMSIGREMERQNLTTSIFKESRTPPEPPPQFNN